MAQAKRDWLEPPAWWKKWRPLRLVLMGTLLICFVIVIRPLLDPDAQYVRQERAPKPTPVAATDTHNEQKVPSEATAPPPEPVVAVAAEHEPEPTVMPTPASTAQPTPVAETKAARAETETDSTESPPGVPLPPAQPASASAAEPTPPATKFTALAPPVDLLSPFRSYMRVDAVMSDLQQGGYLPALESSHQPVSDDVPPHDVDIITVREYKHWDQSGRLEMTFFNDRLYQTEFEPEDAASYRAQQRKYLPELPRERSGRSEMTRGHLRIASSLDLAVSEVGAKLRSRAFLLWQDLRLVQQREEWDQRYALEAVTR
ncbi:hypothetical protein E4T66_12580 [Sinimarinibacterium sp. CAU 1509]|uniref:hypothetical protein n=1 Tax=Sinimarinibacterium sp. CAU 1509 TaxID=2562283 RepID=UPI0010ABF24B|nr:hypothetical protein [Sinimarinibacterium sp. CAU 1509]TJY60011.1 hypothetical protein E4T66_12580 [Sinimarinibacterium sp. CAU 1509]